jgi:WD40 repeat protein
LAVASGDTVVLWQQRNQSQQGWKPEPLLWHQQRVHALAFAPDSNLLASASADGTVGLWDSRGRLRQPLEGEGQGFQALAWRPDGRHLAAGGDQGRWWLWPVEVPSRERQRRSGRAGFG